MKHRILLTLVLALAAVPLFAQPHRGASFGPQQTINGTVVSFTAVAGHGMPALVVADGSTNKTFVLGPFWQLQESKFAASAGDSVTVVALTCSNCPNGYAVVSVTNHTNGTQVTLRDSSGTPSWTGGPGMGRNAGCPRGAGVDVSRAATFEGTVVSFAGGPGAGRPLLTVATASGNRVFLLAPYRVLLDAGYTPASGAQVVVTAAPLLNSSVEEWPVISLHDVASGLTIVFRDASGFPQGGMHH